MSNPQHQSSRWPAEPPVITKPTENVDSLSQKLIRSPPGASPTAIRDALQLQRLQFTEDIRKHFDLNTMKKELQQSLEETLTKKLNGHLNREDSEPKNKRINPSTSYLTPLRKKDTLPLASLSFPTFDEESQDAEEADVTKEDRRIIERLQFIGVGVQEPDLVRDIKQQVTDGVDLALDATANDLGTLLQHFVEALGEGAGVAKYQGHKYRELRVRKVSKLIRDRVSDQLVCDIINLFDEEDRGGFVYKKVHHDEDGSSEDEGEEELGHDELPAGTPQALEDDEDLEDELSPKLPKKWKPNPAKLQSSPPVSLRDPQSFLRPPAEGETSTVNDSDDDADEPAVHRKRQLARKLDLEAFGSSAGGAQRLYPHPFSEDEESEDEPLDSNGDPAPALQPRTRVPTPHPDADTTPEPSSPRPDSEPVSPSYLMKALVRAGNPSPEDEADELQEINKEPTSPPSPPRMSCDMPDCTSVTDLETASKDCQGGCGKTAHLACIKKHYKDKRRARWMCDDCQVEADDEVETTKSNKEKMEDKKRKRDVIDAGSRAMETAKRTRRARK